VIGGIPQELLGTIPGWITSGGIITIVVTLLKRNVKIRELDDKKENDVRDFNEQRDVDLRQHYAEELGRVITRQHECEAREHELRKRVEELEHDILGLLSIIRQASADKVMLLTPAASETIQAMAQRITKGRKI
jgi:tRNA(Met) C34 N-acetyltransferase TmcA